MKNPQIDPTAAALFGGIFHQDTLIEHSDLETAMFAFLDIRTERELKLIIGFCEELLKPDYSAGQRRRAWIKAVGRDWVFTDESLLSILDVMREEYGDELKRRFG